jgi:uncharacterized DUF497 family protein
VQFEWDPEKDKANQRKHGLGFAEIEKLFRSGIDYLEIFDEHHSHFEERFITIGPIARGIVVVAWTERIAGTIRIISGRFATKVEQELYREFMEGCQ